jgi:hypothetical protein
MAFCNSCGANIVPGTRFCSKCGAAILASSLPPVASPPAVGSVPPSPATPPAVPTVPASGGSALKAILIVVGVIVLVGILGITSLAFFAWRVARHAHISQEGDNVKVETPFGTFQTTKDPQEAARNLGVDIYPGAEVLREGASSATLGSVHTASLKAETTDSLDQVCSFYKSKFPNANVTTSGADQCSIVSSDQTNVININLKTVGDKTHIMITHVTHKSETANPPSN